MEQQILTSIINAGVGGAIAALIIYLIYRLIAKLTLDIGMKMVAAFESQAKSMDELAQSIRGFVDRDETAHREMLVLLRYIAQQQQSFEEVRFEHRQRKEQAYKGCDIKSSQD